MLTHRAPAEIIVLSTAPYLLLELSLLLDLLPELWLELEPLDPLLRLELDEPLVPADPLPLTEPLPLAEPLPCKVAPLLLEFVEFVE